MKISTTGLIIKEQNIAEQDKLLTILTKDYGVIKAFARNAKNIKRSLSSSTSLLCYSSLDIFMGKDSYIINDAKTIEMFINLRKDIQVMSLAQYFCELVSVVCVDGTSASEELSTVLNALFLISKSSQKPDLIKACVEMRLLSLCGYMPDLLMCFGCRCYESKKMFFLPKSGKILCEKCSAEQRLQQNQVSEPYLEMDTGITTALRHTIFAEPKKLFSFNLPDEKIAFFNKITECYLQYSIEYDFKTLKFYKQFCEI